MTATMTSRHVRGFATIGEQVKNLRAFAANPRQRIRTGIESLDYITEGPAAGEIYTFLGRSFAGKSLLATQVMAHNADLPMLFFSMEMPARMALMRLYSQFENLDQHDVQSQVRRNALPSLIDELGEKLAMHVIYDKGGLTLGDMSAVVGQYEEYYGMRPICVLIDYLELVKGGSGEGHFQTESVSKALKDWAKDEDVAVFLLHQTNRSEDPWDPPNQDSARGAGYAQPIDEPVLTPTGWVAMGDLSVGDEVVGSDGQPTLVTGVFPLGSQQVYEVSFRDGASTRATGEHLWQVTDDNGRERVCRTFELNTRKGGDRVPVVAPVKGSYLDLPISPYVLGALLGDGSFEADTNQRTSLWDFTGEIVDAIRAEGYKVSGNGNRGRYTIPTLLPAVRSLGLSGKKSRDKFVPDTYLWASTKQRLALLRGLMDTDGSTSGTRCSYATNSPHLRDAVVHLVRSLGGLTSVVDRESVHGPSWDVYLYGMPSNPFRMPSKADVYAPSGNDYPRRVVSVKGKGYEEVQCISVARGDGLYVTKDHIVTHNTEADVVVGLWQPALNPKLGEVERGQLEGIVRMNVLKNRINGRTTGNKVIECRREDSLILTDLSAEQTRRYYR